MKKEKAFTLIELLVVIVLIGILSGIILNVVNIGGIRSKSRDAQRASDLKKIQTALELYFSDNRSYPISAAWQLVSGGAGVGSTLVSGNYITVIPVDPSTNSGTSPCSSAGVGYFYIGNAGSYILATNMEVPSSKEASACTSLNKWSVLPTTCPTPTGNCYGVENPF